MRVLHVMKGSEAIYGAERVIFAEMHHSRQRGVDARFLMLEELRHGDNSDLMGRHAEDLGIPVIRVPVTGRISWSMIRSVRDAILAADVDLVHTHGYKGDVVGGTAARLARVPALGELHGWLFPKDDLLIRFYEWLDVQVLKTLDRVVVLAEHYRRMILRMGFCAQRIEVVPSGVDVAGLTARAGRVDLRARLGLAADTPVVGMLTRLSPEKGVDVMLRAMALLRRDLPAARCVIFGDGDEREHLQQLARQLGVAEHVIWAGYTDAAMDALRALDVVAQTSRFEALPQTLMEAMVMKRPTVVTPVGGCPELVLDGETGYVVPRAEPELLAAAIGQLLTDRQRARRFGEAGAARIEALYTMDRWAERIEGVYQRLLR